MAPQCLVFVEVHNSFISQQPAQNRWKLLRPVKRRGVSGQKRFEIAMTVLPIRGLPESAKHAK